MSFQSLGYYLIQPRPELAEWLKVRTDADMVELLTEPKLVTNDEFIGKTPWRLAENTLRVKLLFIAGLRDLDPITDDSGCEAILGSAEISTALFDRWWTILPVDLDCNVKEYMGELTRSRSSIRATGNPIVDEWLFTL